MGQDQSRAGDDADLARAGGDVLEGAPALAEHREPAFSQAAQGTLDGVAGAGVDIEFPAAAGLSDRNQDAAARAFMPLVGERGQPGRGGRVERR
jgi:hypothetical protein